MMAAITEIIEPLALASSGRIIEGRLPVSLLPRLLPLLELNDADTQRDVGYLLEFGVDEGGTARITGSVTGTLPVKCQRCMEAMELPVVTQTLLGIVRSREAAEQLPVRYEPLLLTMDEGDDGVSIASIIEDELILALPLVAMHKQQDCPQGDALMSTASEEENAAMTQRKNPFAVLSQLKTSSSEKTD
jgi:uncharacterized protein